VETCPWAGLPGQVRTEGKLVGRMGPRFLVRASDKLHLYASLQIFITDSICESLAEPALPFVLTPELLLVEQVQGPLELPAELFTEQQADFEGIGDARDGIMSIFLSFVVLADSDFVFGKQRRVEWDDSPVGQGIAGFKVLECDLRMSTPYFNVVLIG